MTITDTETEYISSKELKDLRGFTDPAIKKFLGECDKTKKNTKNKSAPIKLYSLERVNKVLSDPSFIEWQNKKNLSTFKRKQAIVDVEPSPNVTVVPKLQAVAAESISQPDAFDFDRELLLLKTADWSNFEWQHFREENDEKFSKEQKLDAITTVSKMLLSAYWFTPKNFFNAFSQCGSRDEYNSDLVGAYKSSILAHGWMGIPLVSLMTRDRQNPCKISLDSGHHRWIALKELSEMEPLPKELKIPVFDLKGLRSIVRDRYSSNLDFALSYAFTGGRLGHDFALRVIAKNWFTRLCTGVDCSY
ncbi:MAG: hypothetical protein IM535_21705 [Pseudanabaena sp. M38BS1SP1A06MG]|nr:hypothetical protein [Pseudanabaena sp. M53BS1SP1A06MG]MCA6594638.1 hypothetical protein [Pseudanabaena sp. M38BS1SP1A06MG]